MITFSNHKRYAKSYVIILPPHPPIPVTAAMDGDGSESSGTSCGGGGGGGGRRFFVAVHVGAGYHSPSSEKPLRLAMNRACLAAAAVLRQVCLCVSAFCNDL